MAEEPGAQPHITLTESAVQRVSAAIEAHPEPAAGIRVAIAGRGPQGFQHSLSIVDAGETDDFDDDTVIEVSGITIFMEGRNVEYLDGVRIDFEEGPSGGVIKFENPNPLWLDPVSQKLQELFDTQLNPQITAHGGVVNLLGVEGEIAYIELGGGCVGCGMVDVTLKQGIEVAIKETVPEIKEVVDSTDHSSGSNPYYQPSKK